MSQTFETAATDARDLQAGSRSVAPVHTITLPRCQKCIMELFPDVYSYENV